ncbi:hypothetical protein Ciccas_013980 [Cichlidogyrus casuarinus]|uniref:Uncharacterized protein n=1 Tax=Cichlidogyrus casuarinus TaxID=1844966 RepID=A0ABD2PKM2_9PLAT
MEQDSSLVYSVDKCFFCQQVNSEDHFLAEIDSDTIKMCTDFLSDFKKTTHQSGLVMTSTIDMMRLKLHYDCYSLARTGKQSLNSFDFRVDEDAALRLLVKKVMQSDDCGLSWHELQLVYEEFMITHQDRLRSAATTRAKFNARYVETGILLESNSHPPRYFQPRLHSESVDEELRELAASLRRLLNHSADMPKRNSNLV